MTSVLLGVVRDVLQILLRRSMKIERGVKSDPPEENRRIEENDSGMLVEFPAQRMTSFVSGQSKAKTCISVLKEALALSSMSLKKPQTSKREVDQSMLAITVISN
jgi:hypothetical protein